jgi:non-ribosomal peptide synthetase component F
MQFRDVEPELSKFELTVTLRETSGGLVAVAEFSRELFDTETIVQFLAHFETLLRGIAAAPGSSISRDSAAEFGRKTATAGRVRTKPAPLTHAASGFMNCSRLKFDAHRTPLLRRGPEQD